MDLRYLFLVKILVLEIGSLIRERLYPMETEEVPQGVPDRGLVFHVEPRLDQMVQCLYVDGCEGQAETIPGGLVGYTSIHIH